MLGVMPTGDAEKVRFSSAVHWAYGTSWGAMRGALGAFGQSGPPAAAAFLRSVGQRAGHAARPGGRPAGALAALSALALDALHHLVYAAATGAAYAALDQRGTRR